MKLSIAQVVLERAEFAHRADYLTFAPNTPIANDGVQVTAQMGRGVQNPNNAALVRLTAKSEEGSLYYFDVSYVVFYTMEWDEGEEIPENLDHRLVVTGSTMLLPFIRETVASLTGRGRFGPTWLAPANFQMLDFKEEPTQPEPAGASG